MRHGGSIVTDLAGDWRQLDERIEIVTDGDRDTGE